METMSSTGPTAGESTLVGALLDVIHTLPDVEQVAVLGQLRTITREGTDIDAQLKEMDGNEDIDEHLYRLRREVRKTALQAVWQRQLELWRSHIDTHLNILKELRELEETLTSIDKSIAEFGAAIAQAEILLGKELSHHAASVRSPEEKKTSNKAAIAARAEVERMYQRSRQRLFNPLGVLWQLMELEVRLYVAAVLRFTAKVVFGMAIFLAAGIVHELHPDTVTWYVSLLAIPLGVALAELLIHHFGEGYFERWAHRNRVSANRWLANTRMIMAVQEALIEIFARKPPVVEPAGNEPST